MELINKSEVINITAETGALETQSRVRDMQAVINISDNSTNGDVIKALFPNLEQDKERLRQKYGSQALYDTFEKWCELPYKAGDTDGNS